jgi:hypothetical protein
MSPNPLNAYKNLPICRHITIESRSLRNRRSEVRILSGASKIPRKQGVFRGTAGSRPRVGVCDRSSIANGNSRPDFAQGASLRPCGFGLPGPFFGFGGVWLSVPASIWWTHVVVLIRSSQPRGLRGKHRIGLGSGFLLPASAQAGSFGEGAGSNRMSGNEVRVKSHETDVMGSRCAQMRGVVRCVSVADTSLSLSLSLSAIRVLG